MRIAIFHLGFFYSGGGEKLVIEEMRGLRALGHEVTCFAPYVDRRECYPGVPEMNEVQALLPPPPRWLPMRGPIWVMLTCLVIPIIAGRFRSYDILLGANQPGPWMAFVVGRLLHKPFVAYLAQALRLLHPRQVDLENGIRIREDDHRFLMAMKHTAGWLIDRVDRLSVGAANVVLTNGDHVRRWIRDVYGIESESCPAGCHPLRPQQLSNAERRHGTLTVGSEVISRPFMLLTNRHAPMKRFEYALWALKAVRRSVPNLALVVTGQETEYTGQLRYLASTLNLDDAVHFVGLVSEEDLQRLYLSALIYVYPSPEEDFGMGIVEAMAAGAPVVAWNNGGPTMTVKHGHTGYLVQPYDTDEFAQSILRLATDPALAESFGRAGHKRVNELFSYARHNQILEAALMRAVREYGAIPSQDQAIVASAEIVSKTGLYVPKD
jgi:glycosyltransferase involved in cell wall biosynthesis